MPNVSTAQYGAGLSLFVPAIRALVEGGRTISINPGHREQWDRRPAWHGTVYGNGRPGTGRERVVPAGVMIDSSTPNVQLKNRDGTPKIPSAGAEFFMLYIEETYTGKGSSNTMFLLGGLHAFGGHHHEDRSNACGPGSGPLPEPDLQPYNRSHRIDSGETVAGNICFEIATTDASSLLLYVRAYTPPVVVWFALH